MKTLIVIAAVAIAPAVQAVAADADVALACDALEPACETFPGPAPACALIDIQRVDQRPATTSLHQPDIRNCRTDCPTLNEGFMGDGYVALDKAADIRLAFDPVTGFVGFWRADGRLMWGVQMDTGAQYRVIPKPRPK